MKEKKGVGQVHRIIEQRKKNQKRLETETPLLFEGFDSLMTAYYAESALSTKYKELIAIALSISRCCVPCLAVHTKNAVAAGATREEVIDAAKIGVEFGGGPSFVVVRNHSIRAFCGVFLEEIREIRGPYGPRLLVVKGG
ncbi:MAG: carboxymuconolactone decarboxylase family protein [Methanoregula sp.]